MQRFGYQARCLRRCRGWGSSRRAPTPGDANAANRPHTTDFLDLGKQRTDAAGNLTLPVIGTVRTHENTRRIERLITKGRARVLAISLRRNGTRLDASVRVLAQRPNSRAWRILSHGSVSMWVCGVWPPSPPTDGSRRRKPATFAGMCKDIGWDETWQCGSCSVTHRRDANAAINLARYEDTISVVGPVGPPSSVEPTVRPGRAGQVAVKRGRDAAARLPNNPRRGASCVTTKDHSLATALSAARTNNR
ncbi:transposase domain protein [Mycobacterium xenopi 3993]|nr:transposase domain protein [Mycobacterium xenopi 3993]